MSTNWGWQLRSSSRCFLKENHTPFTKAVRHKPLLTEIDEAVVTAHHLQVGRDAFLALVQERLDYFDQKALSAGESVPANTTLRKP